jgi:hypothetical protein
VTPGSESDISESKRRAICVATLCCGACLSKESPWSPACMVATANLSAADTPLLSHKEAPSSTQYMQEIIRRVHPLRGFRASLHHNDCRPATQNIEFEPLVQAGRQYALQHEKNI